MLFHSSVIIDLEVFRPHTDMKIHEIIYKRILNEIQDAPLLSKNEIGHWNMNRIFLTFLRVATVIHSSGCVCVFNHFIWSQILMTRNRSQETESKNLECSYDMNNSALQKRFACLTKTTKLEGSCGSTWTPVFRPESAENPSDSWSPLSSHVLSKQRWNVAQRWDAGMTVH